MTQQYKKGFNEGLTFALKMIEQANLYHKATAQALIKTIERQGKK